MSEVPPARWLLLIHQIPPQPSYLRVKIGRRLQGLGAVAVKNSVYVLPRSDQALEDFQWVRQEIVAGRGEASVCEARFVEGLSDADVEALFSAAREADYEALSKEARQLQGALARRKKGPRPALDKAGQALLRLRKQLGELAAIDFFGSRSRDQVEGLLAAIEATLRPPSGTQGARPTSAAEVRGRTWVTRSGVYVDRIASAWLIRRFVDPEARFKFVADQDYQAGPGELRFDMFEAEFTHEGDRCTFEVLGRVFAAKDSGLREVAEIVHDIDLKDGKFGRPEAPGVDRLMAGIALRHQDDETRLREGFMVFEGLYEYFKRQR